MNGGLARLDDLRRTISRAVVDHQDLNQLPRIILLIQGIDALLDAVAEKLSTLPPVYTFEETEVDETPLAREYTVTVEDDAYVLKGPSIDSLIASVNFEDYESLNWFQRTMRKSGIINALREKGCTEGDTVRMGDMEFDFVE